MTHMEPQPHAQGRPFGLGRSTGVPGHFWPLVMPGLAVVLSLFLAGWLLTVADRLHQVGIPAPGTGVQAALYPGANSLPHSAVRADGDWVTQEVGGERFLATRASDASLTIPFYGTALTLIARTGPDAGRVYVTIDGNAASGLPSDETGSFLDLEAPQASTEEIPVTSGLRPGYHVVVLQNGPDAEFAASSVEVSNRPALGWVLSLMFTSLGSLLFLSVRRWWLALAADRGWLSQATVPETADNDALA